MTNLEVANLALEENIKDLCGTTLERLTEKSLAQCCRTLCSELVRSNLVAFCKLAKSQVLIAPNLDCVVKHFALVAEVRCEKIGVASHDHGLHHFIARSKSLH